MLSWFLNLIRNNKNKCDNPNTFNIIPNDILKHIVSYLDLQDMRALAKTSRRLQQVVEETHTTYFITTKNEKRFGTYAEIRDIFKKRADNKLHIEKIQPTKISKFLTSDRGAVTICCLFGIGLIGYSQVGPGRDITITVSRTWRGYACLASIAIGGAIVELSTLYGLSKGHSLFSNRVKTKEKEAQKQLDEMNAKYPKPFRKI